MAKLPEKLLLAFSDKEPRDGCYRSRLGGSGRYAKITTDFPLGFPIGHPDRDLVTAEAHLIVCLVAGLYGRNEAVIAEECVRHGMNPLLSKHVQRAIQRYCNG